MKDWGIVLVHSYACACAHTYTLWTAATPLPCDGTSAQYLSLQCESRGTGVGCSAAHSNACGGHMTIGWLWKGTAVHWVEVKNSSSS